MKYKILSTGTLCTCDGQRHTYHKDIPGQPNSAVCWCANMSPEGKARWRNTEDEARELAKKGGKV